MFNIPTSTFSWYNSLFYSLRRYTATLVLTGTSIPLCLELVWNQFNNYRNYKCILQVRPLFFYKFTQICIREKSLQVTSVQLASTVHMILYWFQYSQVWTSGHSAIAKKKKNTHSFFIEFIPGIPHNKWTIGTFRGGRYGQCRILKIILEPVKLNSVPLKA